MLLSTKDRDGAKLIVTALNDKRLDQITGEPAGKKAKETYDHFESDNLKRFAAAHHGRQGMAVLGFSVPAGGVETVRAAYAAKHPKLLVPGSPRTYDGMKMLEVFAYYKGDVKVTDGDTGTIIRFVEGASQTILPGLKKADAVFDAKSQPAYCDHWVSNVASRTGFCDTLNDTLGFTPKVDFNAGVVAAGEAQIESTVTGNTSGLATNDKARVLKDQSQVYLPTNNALSEVGHVHTFVKEIGQGVQHIAALVEDLPSLIQNANDYREMTGAGMAFLQIPRSYYGYLDVKHLAKECRLDEARAKGHVAALKKAKVVDERNIVDLNVSKESLAAVLPGASKQAIDFILRARYSNLYDLLKENVTEALYLRIVRNNILVDIQGEDLLFQIFSAKVLQREDGQEGPFFEFIQRVCSESKDPKTGLPRPIKAGCGGFGIRNFLTLFLSIEVSKAMGLKAEADAKGDAKAAALQEKMVEAFTSQLGESNPVLTAISDAMTLEGAAVDRGDDAEAKKYAAEKARKCDELQEVSNKYKKIMKQLREAK